MREFDVQSQFDSLAGDVDRRTITPVADAPVRAARRRRRTRVAVAVAAAVAVIGVASTTDVLDRGRAAEPAQPGLEQVEGAGQSALTQRLLRSMPEGPGGETMVFVTDVESFFGAPGIDAADPTARAVSGYIKSTMLTLEADEGTFTNLVGDHLVSYVGNQSQDLFVLDAAPETVEFKLRADGWEDGNDGVLVPGSGDSSLPAPLKKRPPGVRIDAIDTGRTLLAIGDRAGNVPDILGADPAGEPTVGAQRLLDLGGAVGFALDFGFPCAVAASTLASPSRATALIVPPEGVPASDVTATQIAELYGVTAVERVQPVGDVVSAELALDSAEVPDDFANRMGLPGSQIC